MQEYLGIRPRNVAEGALQDVHWGEGLFGYFPTYTLGAIMAYAFFRSARKDLPDMDKDMEKGDFKKLRQWLKEKIHSQGSLPGTAQQLCINVTGEEINVTAYMQYLKEKVEQIYGI